MITLTLPTIKGDIHYQVDINERLQSILKIYVYNPNKSTGKKFDTIYEYLNDDYIFHSVLNDMMDSCDQNMVYHDLHKYIRTDSHAHNIIIPDKINDEQHGKTVDELKQIIKQQADTIKKYESLDHFITEPVQSDSYPLKGKYTFSGDVWKGVSEISLGEPKDCVLQPPFKIPRGINFENEQY